MGDLASWHQRYKHIKAQPMLGPFEPSLNPLCFDPALIRPRDGLSSYKGALTNTSSPVAVIHRVCTLRRLCTVLALTFRPVEHTCFSSTKHVPHRAGLRRGSLLRRKQTCSSGRRSWDPSAPRRPRRRNTWQQTARLRYCDRLPSSAQHAQER